MAALTQDILRTEKEGRLIAYKVKGGVKIFKNAMVAVDATGYLIPAAAGVDNKFIGIAYEGLDATNLTSGDAEAVIRVERKRAFEFTVTGYTQADVGIIVYATTDNDLAKVSTGDALRVGTVLEVISATKILVAIND